MGNIEYNGKKIYVPQLILSQILLSTGKRNRIEDAIEISPRELIETIFVLRTQMMPIEQLALEALKNGNGETILLRNE